MKFTKYQFNFSEAPWQALVGRGPPRWRAADLPSEVIKGRRRGSAFHFTPFVHICSWIIPFSTLPNHWRRLWGRGGVHIRAKRGLGGSQRSLPCVPGPRAGSWGLWVPGSYVALWWGSLGTLGGWSASCPSSEPLMLTQLRGLNFDPLQDPTHLSPPPGSPSSPPAASPVGSALAALPLMVNDSLAIAPPAGMALPLEHTAADPPTVQSACLPDFSGHQRPNPRPSPAPQGL